MHRVVVQSRSRLRRFAALCAASLAFAAVVGGCGDDDDGGAAASGSSLSTSSLGKAQYVKRASAACEKERANLLPEISAYLEKHDSDKVSEGELLAQMYKAVVLPIVEQEIAVVRKLGAPEGDEAEIESMLTAQEAAVEKAKGIKSAKSPEEMEDPFMRATQMYRDYGFTACTNSP